MPKTISIALKGTIQLPDNAEVIRFRDEDGIESDHIKFMGRLFRPDIAWMEYFSTAIMRKRYPGLPGGQGWESPTDATANNYFISIDEEWYLEESQADSTPKEDFDTPES